MSSIKRMLAKLGATAEATAKASHGKAKVVQSEGFNPLAPAEESKDEDKESKKPKPKAKSKKTKPKAEAEEEEEAS